MLEDFGFNDEGLVWVFRDTSGAASTEPIVLKCTHEDLFDAFVKYKAGAPDMCAVSVSKELSNMDINKLGYGGSVGVKDFNINDPIWVWKFCIPKEFTITEKTLLQYKRDCLFDAFVKSKKEVSGMRLTVSSGVKKLVYHGTNSIPEDALLCPDCAVRCAKAVVEPLQDGYVLSQLGVYCCTDSVISEPKQYRFKCEKCGCEWLWHQYDILGSGNRDLEKETTKCCCDGGCSCDKHE